MKYLIIVCLSYIICSCSWMLPLVPEQDISDYITSEHKTKIKNNFPTKDSIHYGKRTVGETINNTFKDHCKSCLSSDMEINEFGDFIPFSNSFSRLKTDIIQHKIQLNAKTLFSSIYTQKDIDKFISSTDTKINSKGVLDNLDLTEKDILVTSDGRYILSKCDNVLSNLFNLDVKLFSDAIIGEYNKAKQQKTNASCFLLSNVFRLDCYKEIGSEAHRINNYYYNLLKFYLLHPKLQQEKLYMFKEFEGYYVASTSEGKSATNNSLDFVLNPSFLDDNIAILYKHNQSFVRDVIFKNTDAYFLLTSKLTLGNNFKILPSFQKVKDYFRSKIIANTTKLPALETHDDIALRFNLPGIRINNDELNIKEVKCISSGEPFKCYNHRWEGDDIVVDAKYKSGQTHENDKPLEVEWKIIFDTSQLMPSEEFYVKGKSVHNISLFPQVSCNLGQTWVVSTKMVDGVLCYETLNLKFSTVSIKRDWTFVKVEFLNKNQDDLKISTLEINDIEKYFTDGEKKVDIELKLMHQMDTAQYKRGDGYTSNKINLVFTLRKANSSTSHEQVFSATLKRLIYEKIPDNFIHAEGKKLILDPKSPQYPHPVEQDKDAQGD